LEEYIAEALADLAENDVRIVFLGEKTPFPDALRKKMEHLEAESAGNSLILNIAMNYGGRDELLHAANAAIAEGKTTLTEADIDANLYTKLSPPPDLIVRTANERRLSNFLLWQSAYAELYFTPVLWPDFKPKHIDEAIRDFYARKRNFGGH
jgi:undecaprenyl diphosphate synthase